MRLVLTLLAQALPAACFLIAPAPIPQKGALLPLGRIPAACQGVGAPGGARRGALLRRGMLPVQEDPGPAEAVVEPNWEEEGLHAIDEFIEKPSWETLVTMFASETGLVVLLTATLAFGLYPSLVGFVADLASQQSNESKDASIKVLATIVTPVVGIVFATLCATTLNTLRTRQEQIRVGLMQECVCVDTLVGPYVKLSKNDTHRYRRGLVLLYSYASCVVKETTPGVAALDRRKLLEIEKQLMLGLLKCIGEVDYELAREDVPLNKVVIFSRVVGYANGLCNTISQIRSKRRGIYQTEFPTIHWCILYVLGSIIPINFVILASEQVMLAGGSEAVAAGIFERVLFAIVLGVILALLSLLADLSEPFSGHYRVTEGQQFGPLRDRIQNMLTVLDEGDKRVLKEQQKMMEVALNAPSELVEYEDPDNRPKEAF